MTTGDNYHFPEIRGLRVFRELQVFRAFRPLFSIFLLLFLFSNHSFAQSDLVLSATGCYTIPNSSEWSYIADFGPGVDAAIQLPQVWCLQENDSTVHLLRRPYNMGLRSNFTYFPNAIAGHRISQSLYLQERLLERGQRTFFFEFDFGLACYTNPYSRSHDDANVFIGSYLNCMIQVGLAYRYRFMNRSALWMSAMFAHSSNGYLVKPNKGLNYMQLQMGWQIPRRLPSQRILDRDNRLQIYDSTCFVYLPIQYPSAAFPRHDLMLSYASGLVKPRTVKVLDHYYYAYTARVGWQYHLNPVRAVGANLDLTYNTTHNGIRNIEHDEYPLPFYVGLCGNYEATYNRLTLHLGLAAYLLRSHQAHTPYYERVGVFYELSKMERPVRHFVGVSLKAHSAHIDFIEWHYGLRFRVGKHKDV